MVEPQESDLIDLPDYERIEDETFPPFPPPASLEREGGDGAEPDEESGRGAPVPVPPKRTVKRNVPKLDAQRLISERGLPALRHVFDKTKFKGKGHETCLKRIRLDLPVLHEDFISNNDEVGENNDHDVSATELDPFLTNSSESAKFASESSRSLTEEQQERIERNKQLALERRQAKLLSNSQSLGNDLLMNTPSAQTAEGGNPGEDQEEEESDGFNRDLDSPHVDAAADPVNEEEELKIEKTQLDQSC
ncbi:TIMELESS-interacting protein isoform X2 [Camelus dromedarius]|uniref:TIMELESS-interacting protein isoform X2 n=1 Tax=Camelus dromedarius TaxID=9838 RepID=UPI001263D1A2|nr:TIMELESS-interacting protein isoform X2 [Camelus dromedarius]